MVEKYNRTKRQLACVEPHILLILTALAAIPAAAVLDVQGLNNLQSIGQDLAIRGNPQLTALQGMTQSLTSIGTYRGTDIFIEDNPKLADLAGLEASKVAVYGDVTVQRNSPSLPESQVNALKGKAQPVPITIETLMNGLPSNVSRPAASGK